MGINNKNNFAKFNIIFLSLLLFIIHITVFIFWFSWEKDKLREKARRQAILSNDLLGLLKNREQSDLDTLLRSGRIKKDIYNLPQVSQYKGAYLESLYGNNSLSIFGNTPDPSEIEHLKQVLYGKWLTKGAKPSENIFLYDKGSSYLGRYIDDPYENERYLLIIQMRNPHFQQILNLSSSGFTQKTFIFDNNNLLISKNGVLPENYGKFLEDGRYSEKMGGRDFHIVITNNINQWKTFIIFENIFRGIFLKIFAYTFIVTLPMGIIMLIFFRMFSHKFYIPFKNILEFLEESTEGDPNETIHELIQAKKNYEESLPKLKEQFLLNILKRKEQLPERLIEKYHFNFRGNPFFIVGILPKTLLLNDDFLDFLRTYNKGVDMTPTNEHIITIFSSSNIEDIKEIPSEVSLFIGSEVGSFSGIFNHFTHINLAYQEASFCLHSSLRTASNIVTSLNLGRITGESPDISPLKKELLSKIREGGQWQTSFEELIILILSSNQSVMNLKITFIHLLSDILTLDEDSSSTELSEETFFKFENLNTHLKVKKFFEEVIKDIEKKLSLKRLANDSKTSEKIEYYIKEKYLDMNFTISSLADDLGYSISYLEKKFKNTHKLSIKEYLIQTRIDKAKGHLKEDPSLRIKELAWMVGYENSRSFINIFKKYVGTTPGEYKKTL